MAEVNVARLRAPLDSPEMAGLVRALDDVNWLAEKSAGFVWRHRAVDAPVAYGQLHGLGKVVVTVSVWESFDAMRQYVFRSAHALFMQQRSRWFDRIGGYTTAMWWVPAGSEPTLDEAMSRLDRLRNLGPTPDAFSLGRQFDATGVSPRGGPED